MLTARVVVGSVAVVALTAACGCSQSAGTAGESAQPASAATPAEANESAEAPLAGPPSRARGLAIGTVVTHDAKVKILAGHGGDLRVVVRKLDGTLVADGVSLGELRARDPELYEVVTSSRAGYIDATLDLPTKN
jgi:hypothetical protein